MRLDRAVVLGSILALVVIVALTALRVPRTSVASASGVLRNAALSRFPGRAHVASASQQQEGLAADVALLDRNAEAIEVEMEAFADQVGAAADDPGLRPKKRRHPRADLLRQTSNNTIFVALANRGTGTGCHDAVKSAFDRAKEPFAVHFGVADFVSAENTCMPPEYTGCQLSEKCLSDNIRVRRVDPRHDVGASVGRYVAALLYNGEEYVVFAETDHRFGHYWDEALLSAHLALRASIAKPILTVGAKTVPAAQVDEALAAKTVALPCRATMVAAHGGVPAIEFVEKPTRPTPLNLPWVSMRFVFASSCLLRDVPLDPHLPLIQEAADDVLFSARAYTHGYDMFAAGSQLVIEVAPLAAEPSSPPPAANGTAEVAAQSLERAQYLLELRQQGKTASLIDDGTTQRHIVTEADLYGMGDERPLDTYFKFAGIDLTEWRVTKDWCS